MKAIIIIYISFCLAYSTLYSQDSVKVDSSASKVLLQKEEKHEISLPKFDVHFASFYLIFLEAGVRALITQNISLEANYGFVFYSGNPVKGLRYGLNYHLPFCHDLALSGIIEYYFKAHYCLEGKCKYYGLDYTQYTLFLSYIPLSVHNIHLNLRAGGSLPIKTEGLFKYKEFEDVFFSFEIGFSVSFP